MVVKGGAMHHGARTDVRDADGGKRLFRHQRKQRVEQIFVRFGDAEILLQDGLFHRYLPNISTYLKNMSHLITDAEKCSLTTQAFCI